MKYEIISRGEYIYDKGLWVIVGERRYDGLYYAQVHSVLPQTKLVGHVELPKSIESNLKWKKAGRGIGLIIDELSYSDSDGYTLYDTLNFGMYEGHELGLVYAFDPGYVKWLISEIDNFFIEDLELLQLFGAFNEYKLYSGAREAGFVNPLMDEFDSILEFAKAVKVLNPEIRLPAETIALNEKKRLESNIW